jgi:hypothetical protein
MACLPSWCLLERWACLWHWRPIHDLLFDCSSCSACCSSCSHFGALSSCVGVQVSSGAAGRSYPDCLSWKWAWTGCSLLFCRRLSHDNSYLPPWLEARCRTSWEDPSQSHTCWSLMRSGGGSLCYSLVWCCDWLVPFSVHWVASSAYFATSGWTSKFHLFDDGKSPKSSLQ